MARAVGYARVSVLEAGRGEGRDPLSIDAQRAQIEAAARARGLELEHVYTDMGVSGSVPLAERPAGAVLTQTLADAAAPARARRGRARPGTGAPETGGPESVAVLAVRLDRLFRSQLDAVSTLDAWAAAGHRPILLDLGLDFATPMGRFAFSVLAAVAELERGMIRARTRAALDELRRNGRATGRAPFGWRVRRDGILERDPIEQETLARMIALAAAGHGRKAIATTLNKELRPSRGRRWYARSVERILSSQPVTGETP